MKPLKLLFASAAFLGVSVVTAVAMELPANDYPAVGRADYV